MADNCLMKSVLNQPSPVVDLMTEWVATGAWGWPLQTGSGWESIPASECELMTNNHQRKWDWSPIKQPSDPETMLQPIYIPCKLVMMDISTLLRNDWSHRSLAIVVKHFVIFGAVAEKQTKRDWSIPALSLQLLILMTLIHNHPDSSDHAERLCSPIIVEYIVPPF